MTRLILTTTSAQDEENGLNEKRSGDEGDGANENPVNVKGKRTVYYVRSSQQPRFHRFASATSRSYDALSGSGMCYEVRLKAWNCSCPAFAFAGVACLGDGMVGGLVIDDGGGGGAGLEGFMGGNGDESGDRGGSRGFGGLIRGEGEVPVCKHLLACYLAEIWCGFGGCVEERVVGKEEMSGWAAGWGG